ncbi:MAG TPA: DHA2 family efflux MFS transporter permease subunit, partial [Novosphingobium sp.]
MNHAYPAPGQRRLIVIFSMAAAIMNQIDTTIANVALPHMQGTTSASREQIAWVLTSYIIALAIATPLTGWLAGRFGRRRLMLWSIVGFTAASLLCGIASNLDELVLFRLLQGAAGSALVPMSQATLLDIHPPEEHGKAMAVFGLAAIMGPLAGPVLGGWLTENFSWHWVFLINLPIGLFAFIGLSAVMPDAHDEEKRRFDLLGFALLATAIGMFQLMMDRGQLQDWFQSTEIWIEATISGLALFLFIVHVLTAEHPFIRLAIFADRNYVISTLIG